VVISGAYLALHQYGPSLVPIHARFGTFYALLPMGDRVLRTAALISLILAGLAVLSVVGARGLAALQLRRLPALTLPLLECSGRWQPTNFALTSLRWMPFIQCTGWWSEPVLARQELTYQRLQKPDDRRGREKVRPQRRGYAQRLQRHIILNDLFGLAQLRLDIPPITPSGGRGPDQPAMILPACQKPVHRLQLHQQLEAGEEASADGIAEGDRLDTRQYLPGDSMRHILWRMAAKTGWEKLYVRIPERVGEFRIALFCVVGEQDELSAGFARYLIENDAFRREWIFGGDVSVREEWLFGTSTSMKEKVAWTKDAALHLLAASGTERDELFSRENHETRYRELIHKNALNFAAFQSIARREHCALCILFLPNDRHLVEQLNAFDIMMACKGYIGIRSGETPTTLPTTRSADLSVEAVTLQITHHE